MLGARRTPKTRQVQTPRLRTQLQTLGLRPLLLLGALLICYPAWAQDQDAPVTGKPRIRMPEVTYYWDEILQGEMRRKKFLLKNLGDQPLKILDIKTKCHCSTFEVDREIAPNSETFLTMVFDSNKIKPGKTDKEATITTNDPDYPVVKLWYGGPIRVAFHSNPKTPYLRGAMGDTSRLDVAVYPARLGFTVEDAKSAYGLFDVEKIEAIPTQKGGHRISLRKLQSQEPGKKPDFLKLTLLLEDGRKIHPNIPMTVEHLDNVIVSPKGNLLFRSKDTQILLDRKGEPISKVVRVRALNSSNPFKITSARIEGAPEGIFEVETKTLTEGTSYEVHVVIREYPEASYAQGKLIIETDDPSASRHEITLFAKFGRKPPG